MTLRTAGRIAEIADDWSATLPEHSLLTLPPWLATDDEGRTTPVRYALTGEPGAGAGLVAALVEAGAFPTNDPIALLLNGELEAGADPDGLAAIEAARADLAGKLGTAGYPAAASTLPGGYLPGLVGDLTPARTGELLDTLTDTAREWDCPVVSVLHVPDGSPLVPELERRGFVGGAFLAQATLELTATDFDGYLAALPRRRRNNIRRERRVFAEAGLNVSVDAIGSRGADMAALHAEQLRSYGYHHITTERLLGLMERIERHLAPWCRVLVAERDGALEAFALGYEYAGELHLKMTGFSRYAQENFGYFAMSYYSLIEYALHAGYSSIVYGPLAYPAKVFRGCTLAPRSSYLLVPEQLREQVGHLAGLIDRHQRAAFAVRGAADR
ncbi:GNAT family N-acetyltransferase [Actinoplanes sp. KI2]|uniref:GNAT family N-acetyltransferase n=1 Tax=Actinoplanes sp. KI2 TaxID=2983315 RepID=UPI0021D5AA61|nr:GNAT family N-acetyltransferase [Actinoplanes sp. KI2]MCU7729699.1 GNAT family N-acetyltransferase [Actinoplanes sp. KI2]